MAASFIANPPFLELGCNANVRRKKGSILAARPPLEQMKICSSPRLLRPLPVRPTNLFAGFHRLDERYEARTRISGQRGCPLSQLAAPLGSASRTVIDAWPSPLPSGMAAPVVSPVASRPGWADGPQTRIPAPFAGLLSCRRSYASSNSKHDQGGLPHVLYPFSIRAPCTRRLG